MREIKVGNRIISEKSLPFLVAEIGCNFENSFDKAIEMVRSAAQAGADAVKFQTFIPEKLVTKSAQKFWEIEGCTGDTQYEEFSSCLILNFSQYKEIKKIAEDNGRVFFSTAFDEESADLLESLDVPAIKIASMDLTHLPLLRHVARKNKPVILSTGASDIDEIKTAVNTIQNEGNRDIVLQHCITNYPTLISNVNLRMIQGLQETFPEIPVGYSDHTIDDGSHSIILSAVALGARIIEKHFTFDKKRNGYDHIISADSKDFMEIREVFKKIHLSLGNKEKRPTVSEENIKKLARRSLISEVKIEKGERIEEHMVSVKRPGTGIAPADLSAVLGKKASRTIPEDTVITWDDLKK